DRFGRIGRLGELRVYLFSFANGGRGNLTDIQHLRDDQWAPRVSSADGERTNRPAMQTRNRTPLYFGRNSLLPAPPLLNAQGPGSSKSRLAHTALRHVCSAFIKDRGLRAPSQRLAHW